MDCSCTKCHIFIKISLNCYGNVDESIDQTSVLHEGTDFEKEIYEKEFTHPQIMSLQHCVYCYIVHGPGYLEKGSICLKVCGFALLILSHIS